MVSDPATNHAASNHAASNHAASNHAASNHAASNHPAETHVEVIAGSVTLQATLGIPRDSGRPAGAVLFAHGSGSGRHSPRNRFVAEFLREGGLVTLLLDLLTADEEAIDIRTRHLRFDLDLLAERLVGAIDWMMSQAATADLPVGLFGASTGGGAALMAAAMRPDRVRAVVSRGGRPDLADGALPAVRAPTLLIVGGNDTEVIELNQQAKSKMHADVRLAIVPGATHLFEERGALEAVSRLARDWFVDHLRTRTQEPVGTR